MGANRAVGQAVGRNPVAVVIPCHRVIAADGTLGGFGMDLDCKRWLLTHEGVPALAGGWEPGRRR
jgi:methylated-DNA-[protein]-cysteine S-methyltransferase